MMMWKMMTNTTNDDKDMDGAELKDDGEQSKGERKKQVWKNEETHRMH